MKSRDKQRVAALRQITSEFKKVEVDERVEIDDTRALQIFDKMVKQRKDSLSQYQSAGRDDLVAGEQYELTSLANSAWPAALSDERASQSS
ncbi:MAG: GatB/YqeY domain-containing protein [Gammaproteobacteria bacterium]|nr:GatB/YqeY domain-containing protein [Gammaproteobacteria bacterium]